ncbi:MAG: DUF2752 domain-containing protein [Candidatus Firestonebacteria bacterium]
MNRLLLLLSPFVILSGAAFLYLHDPLKSIVYPPCFLKTLTGLNCAGCGTVRAAYSLLHLNIAEAFSRNQLLVLLLPVVVYIASGFAVNTLAGKKVIPQIFNKPGWAILLAALLLVYSILRNIPVYPFTLMIP